MANKHDLDDWVYQALKRLGGSGKLIDVAKVVWEEHEKDLENSGDIFYTWQYDMRWAADRLRKRGLLKSTDVSPRGIWQISN